VGHGGGRVDLFYRTGGCYAVLTGVRAWADGREAAVLDHHMTRRVTGSRFPAGASPTHGGTEWSTSQTPGRALWRPRPSVVACPSAPATWRSRRTASCRCLKTTATALRGGCSPCGSPRR